MSELTGYPIPEAMESSSSANSYTFKDLLTEAAKAECGRNITVRNTAFTTKQLTTFADSISMTVLEHENKPNEVGRSVVDISEKEFINTAKESQDHTAKDITKAIVNKSSSTKEGRSYQFQSNEGVNWGVGGNIGLQVMAMGMAGGTMGLSGNYGKNKSTSETTGSSIDTELGFSYCQEESISVPPGKKVHVTITTYTVRYRLHYKLQFSVPKSGSVFVSYDKPCCCGLARNTASRYIRYSQIVRTLPNFREDDKNAYFTQDGFLSWVGESCKVVKKEAPILGTYEKYHML